ncbi:hypothetical protein BTVI_31005 [Pitangus sulphuratus]|nr:hypothetical protein BTVI_31005 [Pitangus sulphuratus]
MGEEEDGKLLRKRLYVLTRWDGGIQPSLGSNENVFAKTLCYPDEKKPGELSSVPLERNWDKTSMAFEGPLRQDMDSWVKEDKRLDALTCLLITDLKAGCGNVGSSLGDGGVWLASPTVRSIGLSTVKILLLQFMPDSKNGHLSLK